MKITLKNLNERNSNNDNQRLRNVAAELVRSGTLRPGSLDLSASNQTQTNDSNSTPQGDETQPNDGTQQPWWADYEPEPPLFDTSGIEKGIEDIKTTISPIIDYYKELDKARKEATGQATELQGYADDLATDPVGATKRILTQQGEAGFNKLKQKVQNLRTGKEGTGFLPNFIAKTQAELAGAKIPESPRRNIGKASPLRQRVNTKDFYK